MKAKIRPDGMRWLASWVALAALILFASMISAGPVAAESLSSSATPKAASPDEAVLKPRIQATYGKLPLSFEVNQGQSDAQVKFLSRGPGYRLFLKPGRAVLALRAPRQTPNKTPDPEAKRKAPDEARTAVVSMQLLGASKSPRLVGEEALPGRSNYFIGKDPTQWHTSIPNYAKVRYKAVYSGIDLVYHGGEGRLEYDFVLAPGADPKAIRVKFTGAGKIHIDGSGNLVLDVDGGQIVQHAPIVYQNVGGKQQSVPARYVREGDTISFEVAAFDAKRSLIIDPEMVYSTYLGGRSGDIGNGIAVDSTGNVYVTGKTNCDDFPTRDPLQPVCNGQDAFVAKLNAEGSALIYSTYLGGSVSEEGVAIAVDSAGNACVTGSTISPDFPTSNALQPVYGGRGDVPTGDAYVAKLNADGTELIYSTYLGGSDSEVPHAIAVDDAGNAYVTGSTRSPDFPVMAALQPVLAGSVDAYVAKLDAQGTTLVYSTYLGGRSGDIGNGIAADSAGNTYVTGHTGSADFPTTANAMQEACGGTPAVGCSDAFVTKLNAVGSLGYSTYLGGSDSDLGYGVAVDRAGNAYVTGDTNGPNFPTKNAYQTAFEGELDGFVAKLDARGSALIYSTYLGGSGFDQGTEIAVGSAGNAYLTGHTNSPNFPVKDAVQPSLGGGFDAFVAKLDTQGSALVYSTYLGGSEGESTVQGEDIAVDGVGNAYVTGTTRSNDFPTRNALQPFLNSYGDAFVVKIRGRITVVIDVKPGNPRNVINPRSQGRTKVAILSTNTGAGEAVDFDALRVDPATVRFGPDEAEAVRYRSEDVDHDGDADLLLYFKTRKTGIACGDTEATLAMGETYDGQQITGTDAIKTVGCDKK